MDNPHTKSSSSPPAELQQIIEFVRKRRSLLGITQGDLSEIAGVSLRSLKAIEAGRANPSFGLLARILGALGATLRAEVKP